MIDNIKDLVNLRIRFYLYISSFSVLLFGQNYCINVCPFIDGLQTSVLTRNLFIIFLAHIFIRELLFKLYSKPWKNLSIPRHGYYLSIISWFLAGFVAFLLHYILYPNFPVSSHIKLLSSYVILGGAILSQLEYILFEKYFYLNKENRANINSNEKLSNRILESFLIFSFAPTIILFLIIGRYKFDGLIESKVGFEILVIQTLLIFTVLIVAILFRKQVQKNTGLIISSIKKIKKGNYDISNNLNSSDEFAQISESITQMSVSIKKGIDENNKLNQEIVDTQKEVIYTMGSIAESRSKETGNHVKRVAAYSEILALKIGLSIDESKMLRLASPMHDIGKIAIPDNILNKPGRHTEDEFEIMKTHAVLGYEMLKSSNREIIKMASIVAYEHHERYDGTGYPRGLKGEDIHIYGRITSLADVFDALGSARIYKKAWADEQIFELIKNQSGKQFDPNLVKIFFDNIDEFLTIRKKYNDL